MRASEAQFLAGGGAAGDLIRSISWEETPLGAIDTWPQSLQSALSICLGSNFPIAIYWGPELVLLYNDAWSPIPGSKHPWAMGKPAIEAWPELWDIIGPLFAQVFATGEATRSMDQMLPMNRFGFVDECYFDYTLSPIRSEAGQVGGIFNAAIETTARVIRERRTKLLRDLGEATADAQTREDAWSSALPVLASDTADLPFSLFYLVNKDTTTGYDLVGTTGLENHPEITERLSASELPWPDPANNAKNLRIDDIEVYTGGPMPGGPWSEPTQRAQLMTIYTASDELVGRLVIGISPRLNFDIEYQNFFEQLKNILTAALNRGQAQESERRRAEILTELNRAKTRFFSNASHELRTPLTLILGPLENILRGEAGPIDPAIYNTLNVVYRNGTRLLKLVNSLLDFSRIEAGRMRAVFEPIDVGAYTAELVSLFKPAAENAGLTLNFIRDELRQDIYIDRELFEKIIFNLISNAIKFTIQGRIDVRLTRSDKFAVLQIRDTGIGIAQAEIPQVFERFYRASTAGGRTHEGTGIGLALVRELVELHGGTVTMESELGQGTTVSVAIPFGSAHFPAAQLRVMPSQPEITARSPTNNSNTFLDEIVSWTAPAANPTGEIKDRSMAIPVGTADKTAAGLVLVVDDNADMREYLRGVLEQKYTVATAPDGLNALKLIETMRPDLILSDIMMPGLDGMGLMQHLRADPKTVEIPIILLSARAGDEALLDGLNAGADDYLVKPFSARELMARVNANLKLQKLRAETRQILEHSLREESRRKDEFLATLAHELRNPLAALSAAAQLLARSEDSPAIALVARESLARQVDHMARLLDDLLEISRITHGRIQLRNEKHPISESIMAAIETVETIIESKNHQLLVDIPSEPLYVNGDRARLTQLFSNLLTNAAKYTDKGGVIHLQLRSDTKHITVSVSDNGIGIAADMLPEVFEMFSQAQPALLRSEGGLGIGLSLVKGIAQLHGGHVEAHSEGIGKGSAFVVRLPRIMVETSAVLPATAIEKQAQTPPRLRILIADDNADSADAWVMLLKLHGHDVSAVYDGLAAVAAAETIQPQIALLDVGMPGINGYEAAQRIRSEPWGRDILLVAITGWGNEYDRQQAKQAGFDHHFTKPVDMQQIEMLIKQRAFDLASNEQLQADQRTSRSDQTA